MFIKTSNNADVNGTLRAAYYTALCAAMLSPLLWATVPPLVDYPNHLARMWILAHGTTIPELARNYVTHWRILPDLSMDLAVPALARVMPVTVAGRIFVALTMLGLVAGTATLHRVLHGRFAVWPAWSVLFVYDAVLFWGFVDCLFAVAVYLFAFSGWIATREWRTASRLPVFAAIAALLFLLHVFAFGLYGLSVVSYELGQEVAGRRLSLKRLLSRSALGLQFVPGLLLWYVSLTNVKTTYTAYGSLAAKIYALLAPVTFGLHPTVLDLSLWVAAALFLAVSARSGALRIMPEMRFPIAAMIVTAVLMPNVADGSWAADLRLPAALPFVVIAGTRLEISQEGLKRGLGAAAIAVFGLRLWSVSQSWHDYDRWFGEFRRASATIRPGARLLIVESPVPAGRRRLPGVPAVLATLQPVLFWHMGALAVIDRSAFFPYLFTEASPIDVTPRNQPVAQTAAIPITPAQLVKAADPAEAKLPGLRRDIYGQLPYWRDWPRTFDYVLWIDFGDMPKHPPRQLVPVATGDVFEIYKIMKR